MIPEYQTYLSRDARERRRWWAVLWVMAVAGPFIVLGVAKALAHDAVPTAAQPQGWSYPFSCCSGYDCRQVGSSRSGAKITVAETPTGYKISTTGEVIGFGDARLKNSPDGEFHWCSVAGADDSRTICLFVPPRSF